MDFILRLLELQDYYWNPYVDKEVEYDSQEEAPQYINVIHSGILVGRSALANSLTSGSQIILFLYGKPFKYRSTVIGDVCWFTENHPYIEHID